MSTTGQRRCKHCGIRESSISANELAEMLAAPDVQKAIHGKLYCPHSLSVGFPVHDFVDNPPEPEPAPYQPLSIDWWIERVDRVVQEAPQMGTEPILSKAAVMAQLYTVQVLERLVEMVTIMTVCMERRERAELHQAAVLEKIAAALQKRNRQEEESKTLGERVRAEP